MSFPENSKKWNKKIENEKKALNFRKTFNTINSAMPVRVNIGTTDVCNLRCPMCIFPDHSEHGEMPFETFMELGRELFPLAKEYHTTLFGEPLLTSYFKEIPKILNSYQTKMSFVTNGMLLNQKSSKLVIPVLRDIKFSFDGATKRTFEKIRPNSNFELILKNIKEFIELRNSTQYRPTVTLLTTLMYDNIKELPDIINLAYKLGIDRVKACFMVLTNPALKMQSLWFYKELTNEYLDKAEKLATSYGIKTKFYKKFKLNESSANNKKGTWNIDCRFLWEEAWVKVNGDILPCCNIETPVAGNVYKIPFSVAWNNDIYQNMRQRLNSENPYECCKHCILPNEDVKTDYYDYDYKSLIPK